ncbi:MAG TPA: A24 family peptidase [Candidatus Baltobacteraceae bacterium]
MSTFAQAVALVTVFACGVIDARTGLIPNRITYPAFGAILLVALCTGTLASAALGAAVVGGILGVLYIVTRKRGLGFGDVKLGACIGAGLGPITGVVALGTSFIAGGAVGAYLLLSGRAGRKDAIRFGPFLLVGVASSVVMQHFGWHIL